MCYSLLYQRNSLKVEYIPFESFLCNENLWKGSSEYVLADPEKIFPKLVWPSEISCTQHSLLTLASVQCAKQPNYIQFPCHLIYLNLILS